MRSAAKKIGKNGHRDDTMILIMFRHGLRVKECVCLRWDQIDFKQGLLHVKRLKNGINSTHPLRGIELRALKRLQRKYLTCPYVFITHHKTPMTERTAHCIIARAGRLASFEFSIHPHMLRYGTGFYLANKGYDTRAIQSYLGHANIKNTVIYTEISPKRFKDFWED